MDVRSKPLFSFSTPFGMFVCHFGLSWFLAVECAPGSAAYLDPLWPGFLLSRPAFPMLVMNGGSWFLFWLVDPTSWLALHT
jgi:hypothetical protein